MRYRTPRVGMIHSHNLQNEHNYSRASKSPDLVGDLPIFDIIMKISRSDLE